MVTLLIYLWVWCIEMLSGEHYEATRRRLIFLKFKNEELVKKDGGLPFDEGLLAACEAYLSETPKYRVRVYAEKRFTDDDFRGI